MLQTIILLIGGLLASASFLFARSESGRALIGKLAPISGIIGLVVLYFGIVALLNQIDAGAYPLVDTISTISAIVVGLLLSHGLVAKVLDKINNKADDAYVGAVSKLAPLQTICGLVLVVVSVLALIK